ncbi:Major Facilitator Superfamily protein [Georgenia satyanarayanai]|uniref:Major Facilitator Superfamily protein n=1 Tax=Georgenia satyanarayanai TaxID=860221 RepID=A0A2Y9C808_9MICO|nr:MFS transporter [Georgenia satyanarayanai]PYF95609.1 MFS transporter [Georgenia satyanarayanai]SSA47443.1 Major Facilitator Superfamily protein [Georgenia satyanarayanai]
MSKAEGVYSALVKRNPEAEQQMPAQVRRNIAPNGLRLVLANALQASGDQTVNASTVLPWLFAALGVPPALTGVLVPIRESGSMLPQAALTPLVLRVRHRKWIFIVGAFVQAAAVAVMAATAALGAGLTAGVVIVAALAVFAFGRCLCSIASKDVQGRTIPKGERGQINGLATTAAGFVAITLGLGIRIIGGEDLSAGQLAWLLATGAALWVAVAAVYIGIREPSGDATPSEPEPRTSQGKTNNWFTQAMKLLREDKPFRHFVTVRSLLLVSSLSPPFIVTLSIQTGAGSLAGLGGFIIASGVAALIGGRIFGPVADRSSKRLMSIGAGAASAIIIATVAVVVLPGFTGEGRLGNLLFIAAYFSITLMHTGVRVGRKTYVVDMAEGDQRTRYVAVSNSALGLILLIVGGLSSLLAIIHIVWALLFLALPE